MIRPNIHESSEVVDLIRRALSEDLGTRGDLTTLALVPEAAAAEAVVLCRRPTAVAGAGIGVAVFQAVDPSLACEIRVADGHGAGAEDVVLAVQGRARSILTAERTALNFMQRLCGIAALTRRFVDMAGRFGVAVLDTRKTTPGLRLLEKYAVVCGGGENHRMGLYDRILVKDNHRKFWRLGDASRLDLAVAEARAQFPGVLIEVEVETEEELDSALKAAPDWVLLDNVAPEKLRRFVQRCGGRCRLEASGNITLENAEAIAATGVNAISLGCLTHSAPAADLSLEIL